MTNNLDVAFIADNATNDVLISSSRDGHIWANNTIRTGQSSQAAPGLTYFNDKLWLAFLADNDSNDILISSSPNGGQWSDNTKIFQSSKAAPALTAFNNQLWLGSLPITTATIF